MNLNPFDQESLDKIFEPSTHVPNVIKWRENDWIEYKLSFNWGSKGHYAKTMVAFANARGGYIVFGIKNDTREFIGLTTKGFERFDPEKGSDFLNHTFSPRIRFNLYTHTYQGKEFGLLYTYESDDKPVVSIADALPEIKEAEIYYRYEARSEKIKYPELQSILKDQRQRHLEILLDHLRRMEHIGIENAAILDTLDGSVTGPSVKNFVIDESLLDQLRIIQEGEFRERTGDPTLKLVGELRTIDGVGENEIVRGIPEPIKIEDVYQIFLEQTRMDNPLKYIDFICSLNYMLVPIYFFIHLANLSRSEATSYISSLTSGQRYTKSKIIERLSSSDDHSFLISADSRVSASKRMFRSQIINQSMDPDLPVDDIHYALDAVRSLTPEELDEQYVLTILNNWFKHFHHFGNNTKSYFRKAVCHIDILMYRLEEV